MKKLHLICLILSIKFSYSQECKLSLAELLSISNYTLSEFDRFSLEKGFSYNTQDQTYWCDNIESKGHRNLLSREDTANIRVIIYSFFNKKDYLNFKKILAKGELIEEQKEKGILRFHYRYDGRIVILQVATFIDNSNTYMISLTRNL